MQKLFIKQTGNFNSIKSIQNKEMKSKLAISIISSAMAFNLVRKKYINILRRKKYENKIREWVKNGSIIK